jgi:hypothetical protein
MVNLWRPLSRPTVIRVQRLFRPRIAWVALVAVGCDFCDKVEPRTIATVEVTAAKSSLVLTETLKLTAIARDEKGASIEDVSFTWSTTDEAVVTVSTDGTAEAKAPGEAAVVATAEGVSGRVTLTVQADPPAGEFALSVVVGPGVIAVPNEAVTFHPAGTIVAYDFEVKPGYLNVAAAVDGVQAPTSGSIAMTENRTIVATADTELVVLPVAAAAYERARALLTAPDVIAANNDLHAEISALFAQVSPDEAFAHLAAVDRAAFDPVADAAALQRISEALGGTTTIIAGPQVTSGTFYRKSTKNEPPMRRGAAEVTDRPTTVLYVNGFFNSEMDVRGTSDYVKQVAVQAGLFPAGRADRMGFFYNEAWKSFPSASTFACLLRAAPVERGTLQAIDSMRTCVGDGLTVPEQFANAVTGFPAPVLAEAQALASFIKGELTDGRKVQVVAHSHGNMLTQQALRSLLVDAPIPESARGCLAVVSLSPPVTANWPDEEVAHQSVLVRGEVTADFLLDLTYGRLGLTPKADLLSNKLAMEYDRDAAGLLTGGLRPAYIAWASLQLHDAVYSYLLGLPSLVTSLQAHAATLDAGCKDHLQIAPNRMDVAVRDEATISVEVRSPMNNPVTGGEPVRWASRDPNIASVIPNSSGALVQGLEEGETYIIAESDGVSPDSTLITVIEFANRIVYVGRGAFGVEDLYTVHPDGRGTRAVSLPAGIQDGEMDDPAWNLAHTRIAIAAKPPAPNNQDYDIYIVNPVGGGLLNLTNTDPGNENYPAFSPDGTKIAYQGDGEGGGVWVMSATGSNKTRLTASGGRPNWSPDGTTIVFDDDAGIFTVPAVGGGAPQFIHAGGDRAEWSPDGTRILFSVFEASGNNLYTMNPNGTGVALAFPAARAGAWSPDGTRVAFRGDPSNTIYTIPIGGGGPTFVVTAFRDGGFAWR